MSNTILFIHGMFLNPKSWQKWEGFFTQRGFECVAPAWPWHQGEPASLRAQVPPELGILDLKTVTMSMRLAASQYENPILIGHSLGGLIAQILINEGIGSLGVPVCSVAPNRMLALDWGLFRNTLEITNPLKGNEPFMMDADTFYQNFGNAMPREASDAAYDMFAVHESRNVLRDIMTDDAKVDLERPHVPLLFIGADDDQIIPPALCERNARAYAEDSGISEYKGFGKRGHFIHGQPGWEAVADYIASWIEKQQSIATSKVARPRNALHAPR